MGVFEVEEIIEMATTTTKPIISRIETIKKIHPTASKSWEYTSKTDL